MDLTIVIVNWNGENLLRDCLSSIPLAQGSLAVQVIVVDNDSWDGSSEMVAREFPQFHLVNSGGNIGFGKANNLARPLAEAQLVLFLNPDTVLLKDSLVPMVDFIRAHPEVGVLGCKMRYPNGNVQEQGLQYFPSPLSEFLCALFLSTSTRRRFRKFLPYLDPLQSGYVTKLYGGCLLCPKAALDRVGWFDERYFMYAEDVDLCRSILNLGLKVYYLSTAEIIHLAGGASRRAPSGFSVLMKCESIDKMMCKHYGRAGGWFYRLGTGFSSLLRVLVIALLRFVSPLFPGKSATALSGSYLKNLLMLLWALGLRKAVVGRRPVALRAAHQNLK